MNQLANTLNLTQSAYQNPHGLMNRLNTSSARDICLILERAFNNRWGQGFGEVVARKEYTCTIERDGEDTEMTWTNTHKSFEDPRFMGGKTGITIAAGPCLSTLMKLKAHHPVAIVVLCCKYT